MSTPRSGLATLLTLRHARTEATKAELADVRARSRELADTLRREQDRLAAADLSGGGSFAAAAAHRTLLAEAAAARAGELSVAADVERSVAIRYQADHRAERVIEKLLERLELAAAAARARADQAAMDELALARYARAQLREAAAADVAARSAASA